MTGQTNGFNGSTFETLESRMLLTGAFPSAAENAIVYDAKGNLDVAYYDSTAHNLKYVQEATNGTWSTPKVIDGSSANVGQYVTIAIGTGGYPAVAYQDVANADLKFAQYNGSSWSVITVDKRKTTGFNPSLTFDSSGDALISYYKENTGDLDLATIKGKKVTLTTLETAGNVGQFSSIAINPSTGKPSIAYTNTNGQVQYIAKSGAAFTKPATVGKGTGGSSDVSLAFNGSSANVGYVNPGTGAVDLGQLSGKTFTTSTVGTVTTGTTSAPQVLVNPTTHMPTVVYHDSTGVFVATPSTSGGGFQTTQVQSGGTNTVAVVQPGSGSIVFSTVNNSGGTLTINTTTTPPAAPSMVAATATSPTTAKITWVDNSNNEAGFLIERSTDGVTFTTVTTTQPNVTSYTDSGLTEATVYYYRVSAVGAAGNNSAGTTGSGGGQIVPAAGIATATTYPSAPSNVAATASSATAINVTWTNNSHNPTGFIINRSTNGGTTWTQAGSVGANVTTFSDTGLTEGSAYTYEVTAYNGSGGSTSSSTTADTFPAAPSGLSATVVSTSAITVTWQNNSASATGFIVQRSTNGTNFTTIGTTSATTFTYPDSGLSEANSYYYQVIAIGPGNLDSAPSASTNATTDPLAPSNLAATAVSSNRINLTWTDNSAGATNVIVQLSSNGGAFATIATLAGTANSYPDSNRTEGISYTYRIESITGSSASGFSPTVTITTLPAAPATLTATANGQSVTLNWADNSISETGFAIQRSSDNGQTWTALPSAPANSSSTGTYVDNTAGQGATYSYRLAAFNAAGQSAFTNTASATIAPAAPSGLTATAASGTEIDLAWTNNSLGETGTFIERSTDGVTWIPVTTTTASAQTYPDTNLNPGITYNYRISAVNAGGASGYATAIGVTAPIAPANITPTAASTTEVDLTWTLVNGATSYIVQRSTDGVNFTPLPPVTTTSYPDLNLTEGTTYQYTVTAVNAGGSSVPGGPVSIATLPAAPSNVVASGITATSVEVSWTNNSNGATGFAVQRSSDGVNWVPVGTTSTAQITDSMVQEATQYTYRVQAIDSGGTSGFVTSNAVQTVPLAPTNLSATVTGSTSVHLSWNDNSLGATNYYVQRSIDGENFTTIDTGNGNLDTFDDTTAGAATQYWYRIYATNSGGGTSDYSNNAQIITTPAAPQNVVASAISATAVGLTWNHVSGASSYNILRSTDNSNFSPLNTSATNSFTDSTALEGTQYYYIVEAVNSTGSSANSTSATATTLPSAPTSLMVTSTTAGTVVLGWTNTSQATNNFIKIERSGNNGIAWSQIDTAAATATTYTDTTVSEGLHYIYRIRVNGSGGDSAYSNTTGADTLPAAPTGLTVSANSATSVTVSWTDASTHATNYVVSRSSDGGNSFNVVQTLGGSATMYTDTVAEGGSYEYMVRATQTLVSGTILNSAWTPTQSLSTPPAAPSNVNATVISASEVDVTWQNNSANQTGFKIYSSTDGITYNLLGTALSTATTYMDFTAIPGTLYYYSVRATGAGGDSAPAYSSALTSIPAVPTPLSVSTANNPSVVFSWSDVAGETGFDVERSSDGGQTWSPLGSTLQGNTQITDLSSVEDASYEYRVRATNSSGQSAYSSALSASTFLGAPSGLTVSSVTGTQVSLSWTDHSSAAMHYEVQQSADGGMNWTSLTTSLGANATSYTDSTVADGVSYLYQVRALNTAGNSDFTSPVSTTTAVLAPTNLTTTTISTTQINLSWSNPSSTATSFQIWRSTNGGASYTQIDSVSGQTTYSDHALSAGETALYEIFGNNGSGTSAASSAATGTTLPAAPSNLDVEPLSTTSLSLTWQANSSGATGYTIYRDSGDGFEYVTTTSGPSTHYTDSGLTEGSVYLYKVQAVDAGGSSSSSNISENQTYCAAPTNLAVTGTTATSIALSWTNNTQGATGYAVLISTDNGANFMVFDATLDPTATHYTVTGLAEATPYEFQVYAYNGVGPSATSNTVSQTTAPLAPTLGSVYEHFDGLHISWTNNSEGASSFLVERSSNGGATFTQSFPVALGQTSYIDSSGNPNTSYTYEVLAVGAGGNSSPSSTGTAITAPAAPSNLTGTSLTSSSITLTWTPNSFGASGYIIERSSDGLSYFENGTASGSASSYTDNNAVAGTSYQYFIVATNATDGSPAAISSYIATLTAAPTSVTATNITATSVTLNWNDVQGESGFTVQRSDDDTDWTTIGSSESGVTTYTDSTAAEGNTYYYRVAGTNSSGTGDYSTGLSVLTSPAAASNLNAMPVSTTEVDLTWTDNAHAADGYDVYRTTGGNAPVLIAQGLPADTTAYPDTTASAGTSYTYQVFAYNATGSSSAVTATALTIPGQPQNLTAVAPSDSEIDLTWSPVAGASAYAIASSPDGVSNWTSLGQVSTGAYQDTDLNAGTTYYYTVTAINSTGPGQAATISAPTLPAPITSLHASSPSATEVDLSWTDTSFGATGYTIVKSTDGGQNFQPLTTLNSPSANSYMDTTTEGTAYVYRITPIDASGPGDSTDVSITTQPASPTLVSATPVSANEVDLTWNNNSAHATSFSVQRTPFGANTWTTLTSSLSAATTTYPDQSAAAGTNYQYRVLANLSGANSGTSNVIAALTVPAAVTTLSTQSISTTEIDLSWTPVTGATSYSILRSTDGSTFSPIDSVGSGTQTYQDTNLGENLTEGTRYYYQIVAHDSTGDSATGNSSYTSTLATPPTGLSLNVVSNSEIDLSWNNNSTHGPSVGVEVSTTGGAPWTQLSTVSSPGATYDATSLLGGSTYYFRIAAIDGGGTNYMTDMSSVSAVTAPNAPTITATPVTDGTVSLSWTTPATATTYTVEHSTDGVTWNPVVTGTSSTSTIDSGLAGNTTYEYRVSASNGVSGPNSAPASALTVPDAPYNLTGMTAGPTTIDLTWIGDVASNVTYSVYRSPGTGPVHYVKVGTVTDAVAYNDTTAPAGNSYLYEVVAANASGSNVTPALSSDVYTTPIAPAGLAKTVISDTEVDLNWTASPGATSYAVSRSTDGVNFSPLMTLGAGASSYDDMSASGGTSYTYEVSAINSGGSQSSTITALTYPTAPTGLTPTIADNHDINVVWNASTGATSYTLQRSADGGTTWSTVSSSGTSAADVVSGGGTYTYRVKATDATGDSSWASASSVTTVPDAPSGVGATATSDTAVQVTWTLSGGATNYLVQRSDDNGNSWSNASSLLGSSATSFNDSGLTELTPYVYQVIASNAAGNSADSSTASVVTKPTAPSSLATTMITGSEVDLSWNDNSNGDAAFDVERSDDGGSSWHLLGSTATGDTSYDDMTASPGTSYLYRVSADNGSVVSLPTAPLTVLTLPAAPTVTATPINAGEVNLSWNAVTAASSYTIYQEIGAGGFMSLTSGIMSTSYHDMSVSGGTQYTYEVFAVDGTGTGPAGTSNAALTVPAAQSDFAANPVSATQVNLSWSDVTGATGYTIESKTGNNAYQVVTSSLLSTDTSYHDTSALSGTSYTYEIFGTDATGSSTVTTQTALTVPATVAITSATVISSGEIDLTWSADSGTVGGYQVYRSDDGGSTFNQIGGNLSSSTLSYPDTGLTEATGHIYRVLAYNTQGSSANNDTATLTTLASTPGDFTVSGISASEIDLSWDSVTGATGYEVDRLNDDGVTWTTLTSSGGTQNDSFPDTGLTAGTNYTYQVEALDAGGASISTASESAVTTPPTPSNIVATGNSATDISLAWDATPGAASYTLAYSTDGGDNYSSPIDVGTNSYDFSTATAATPYLFQIVAVNTTGSSEAGTSNAVTTVPDAPTMFTATGVSTNQVDLAWDDVTGGTEYEVDRLEQNGSTWDTLTSSVNPGVESYDDMALSGGTTYTYRIEALDAGGASASTPTESALTAPAAPTDVVATPNSSTDVSLSWDAPTGTTSYTISYSTDGGMDTTQLDTGITSTTYDFSTATPGTPYLFSINAVNETGSSVGGLSNSTLTVPAAQTDFAASPVSANQVNLSWTPVTGATTYTIERETGGGQPQTLTSSLNSSASTYQDTTAVSGTTYTYEIFGSDATGPSTITQATALTMPGAVQGLTATPNGTTEVDLAWTADTGTVTGYQVLEYNGSSFAQVGMNLPASSTSYAVTGLTAATAYQFEVVAINGSGASTTAGAFEGSYYANTQTRPDLINGAPTFQQADSTIDIGNSSYEGKPGEGSVPGAPNGFGTSNFVVEWTGQVQPQYSEQYTFYATSDDGIRVLVNGTVIGTDNFATNRGSTTDSDVVPYSFTAGQLYNVEVEFRQNGGGWDARLEWSSASQTREFVQPTGAVSATTIPTTPTQFTATGVSASAVDLAWHDVTGATSYEVDRLEQDGVTWQTLTTSVAPGAEAYVDNAVDSGTSYTYRIEALDAGGSSVPTATQTALTLPATVSITSTTIVGTSEIDLAWTADTGTFSGYRVLRSDDGGSTFTQIGSDLSNSTLSFQDTGLPAGSSHIYQVLAFNNSGESAINNTSVETTLPATPANLAAIAPSSSEIDLTWDSVNGATGYEVDRLDGQTWDAQTEDGGTSNTFFDDTGLTPGTNYTYRIEALDASGPSVSTDPVTTITRPDVVANFTATPVSGGEVDLTWDAATGATGYHILRADADSGVYNPLTTTSNTSLNDTGLTEATDYSYEVIAYNGSGSGLATSAQNVTSLLNTPDLAVTAQTNTSIALQWTNHSLVDTGYLIEQQTGPSSWTDVDDAAPLSNDGDTDSVTVPSLTEATAYNFRVTALGADGLTSASTPATGYTAPNDPTALTATPASTTNVVLHWTNNSANADSQLIERSADGGGTWSTVATVSGSAHNYSDNTGSESTTYEYRVSAFKSTSQSGFATSSSVTTLPLAPTELMSNVVSYHEIDLSWMDESAGATAYRVYGSSDGINYTQVGMDLSSTATSYQDMAAAENALTYYKVVAVDDGGESAGTALTSATTPLAAPTSVVAATTTSTASGDKTINLTWTNVSGVATNVKVERSSDGMTWTPLATLDPAVESYSDDTASENTTYTYRIYAVDGMVASTHAASNSILTLLSRPTGLTVSSPTSTSVLLTWNDVSAAATSYHVERSTDDVNFTDIHTISSSSADTYTDNTVIEGTQYYYRIRAVSGGNTSNYCDVATVTTIPSTPTNLVATPFSTTEINLTWNDVSTTNTGYTVQTSTDGGQTWSTIPDALNGTADSYSDTGLVEATDHEYRVFATGAGGSSLDSNTSSTSTIPATPSSLALASETATSVNLTWNDNSNGETNYEVWRATDGVNFTALTTALPANTTSYTDSTANEATSYQYEIRDNRNSVESAFTSQLSVTTLPAAPTGLSITSFTSSKVSLGWADNSSGETGYKVARSTDGGNSWSVITTLGANSTAYTDNSVTEGLSYSYYVYAYNSAGNSITSGTVVANIPPAAPSGLTITSYTSSGISLSWTNNSAHQTGIDVQRSTNGGAYMQIAQVTGGGNTYNDAGLAEVTTYAYRVVAYGATGNSSNSAVVQQKTPVNAPSNLNATSASTTEIDLTWTNNTLFASGLQLERSTNNFTTFSTISPAASATSYSDTGLTEGTTYTYRLRALAAGGTANSAFTSNVSGTTLPATPSGVMATATSNSQVTVTWTNNSNGATGFTIQRSLDGSTWVPAGTVGAGVTTFNDTGLTELTAYFYRVEANDAGGASAWASTGSSVTTLPAAPSNLAVSAPNSYSVLVTWTDNSAGATGYKVERNGGNGWVQISVTLPANTTSYTDYTVAEATLYTYRVRAVANSVNSAYSNTQSITTVPADPDGLMATTASTTEIDLQWNNNSNGATAYLVEQSLDGGNTFTQIASLSGTATTYESTGLTEGTDYQYRVRAQDAGGYSLYTDSVDASTLPATPSNFLASPVSGQINLTWSDNSSGETSYTVERDNSGVWTTIASLPADSTSFSDTGATGGLSSGQTYQYRVFCTGAGGNSAFASISGTAV